MKSGASSNQGGLGAVLSQDVAALSQLVANVAKMSLSQIVATP
jgi:hypothetical protein